MPRIQSPPFRTASEAAVAADPWIMQTPKGPLVLLEKLPHWDYNTNIDLRRTLNVDVRQTLNDCGLNKGEQSLALLATARTDSGFRHTVAFKDLTSTDDELETELAGILRGSEVGGTVTLETALLVRRPPDDPKPLQPRYPGSVLWSDTHQVTLEGSGSRFPIEVVPFDQIPWAPDGAAWYLAWEQSNLHQTVSSGLQLYVNASNEKVRRSVAAPERDAESTAIVSALYYEVGRTLVLAALRDTEFLEQNNVYGPGSIGLALQRLMTALFPVDSPMSLAHKLAARPSYFEAELQAKLKLFGGER